MIDVRTPSYKVSCLPCEKDMKYIRHYGIAEAYLCEECGESVKIAPIVQQPLSGSPDGSPKSAEPTSDNGKRCAKF